MSHLCLSIRLHFKINLKHAICQISQNLYFKLVFNCFKTNVCIMHLFSNPLKPMGISFVSGVGSSCLCCSLGEESSNAAEQHW